MTRRARTTQNIVPLFPEEQPADATPKTPARKEREKHPVHYAIATYEVTPQGPSGWGMVVRMPPGVPRKTVEFHRHLCHGRHDDAARDAREFLAMVDFDGDWTKRFALEEGGAEGMRAMELARKAACFAEFDQGKELRAALAMAKRELAEAYGGGTVTNEPRKTYLQKGDG